MTVSAWGFWQFIMKYQTLVSFSCPKHCSYQNQNFASNRLGSLCFQISLASSELQFQSQTVNMQLILITFTGMGPISLWIWIRQSERSQVQALAPNLNRTTDMFFADTIEWIPAFYGQVGKYSHLFCTSFGGQTRTNKFQWNYRLSVGNCN